MILKWNVRDVKHSVINKERSVDYLRVATGLFSSEHGLYKDCPFFLNFSNKVLGDIGCPVMIKRRLQTADRADCADCANYVVSVIDCLQFTYLTFFVVLVEGRECKTKQEYSLEKSGCFVEWHFWLASLSFMLPYWICKSE